MTNYLLIWNEFDLGLRTFVIPEFALNADDRDALHASHGEYINAANTSDKAENALQYVLAALSKDANDVAPEHKATAGRFLQYEVTAIKTTKIINRMVIAGFIP